MALLVGLVSVLGALVHGTRVRVAQEYTQAQSYEDVYYLPSDPRVLRVLTLGYIEVAVDLLWMRALFYYSDEIEESGTAVYAMHYAESLVELDPDFLEIYRWAGLIPFYLRQQSPLSSRERGTQLLVAGSDRAPWDGRLAWDAAATVQYELLTSMPADAPTRPEWERTGARLMMRAVRLGTAPDWLTLSNVDLLQRLGESDRAIRHLEEVIATTTDPELARTLANRLDLLRAQSTEVVARGLAEEQRAAHLREFPYVDATSYVLLGPRRFPSSDTADRR